MLNNFITIVAAVASLAVASVIVQTSKPETTMTGGSEESHLLHHAGSNRKLYEDVPMYARPRQRQRWDDTQVL